MSVLHKLVDRSNAIQISAALFLRSWQTDSKIHIWKCKGPIIAKSMMTNKNKFGEQGLPDFKIYYKDTVLVSRYTNRSVEWNNQVLNTLHASNWMVGLYPVPLDSGGHMTSSTYRMKRNNMAQVLKVGWKRSRKIHLVLLGRLLWDLEEANHHVRSLTTWDCHVLMVTCRRSSWQTTRAPSQWPTSTVSQGSELF